MRTKTLLADAEILVTHVTLEPEERTAREIHAAQDETIFLLRGELLLEHAPGETLLRVPSEWSASQAAPIIRSGVEHVVMNVGDDVAEYISIMRAVPEAN